MWALLKRIFLAERSVSEIQEELRKKLEEKVKNSQLALGKARLSLEQQKLSLLSALQQLQNASLSNVQESSYALAHTAREAYAQAIRQFLNEIKIPTEAGDLNYFFANYEGLNNLLGEKITKNHQLSQGYFAQETKDIASIFADIHATIGSLQSTAVSANFEKYGQLQKLCHEYLQKEEKRKILDAQLTGIKNEISDAKNKAETTHSNLMLIQKDKDRITLIAQLENLTAEIKSYKEKIAQPFRALEPTLRKYSHLAYRNEAMLEAYLSDPVEALSRDIHSEILQIFRRIRYALQHGFQRDPESASALQIIDTLTKEELGRILSQYAQLRKRELDLRQKTEQLKTTQITRKFEQNMSILSIELRRLEMIQQKVQQERDSIMLDPKHLHELASEIGI